MGIGIGISLVSVVVSHGCIKKKIASRFARWYRYWLLMGIGIGISLVSVRVAHGYHYRHLMGIGIGISLVSVRVSHGYRSMLVYYVYSAIWDTVILCLRYRSFSTKVQQSSLGLY